VTKLVLTSRGALDAWREGLGALSHLRDLLLADKDAGDPGRADGFYTLPFPQTLDSLCLFLHFEPPILQAVDALVTHPAAIVPASFLSRLTALTTLEIFHRGAGVHFEPLAADVPSLQLLTIQVSRGVNPQQCGARPLSAFALIQRCPALQECSVRRGNWELYAGREDRADAAPWTDEGQEEDFEGYRSGSDLDE
jgi:hypothetical protein